MARKGVLIVDDEFDLRTGIRDILEWSGYEAPEVIDGTEGLAITERLRPDVILLDLCMRGLDGFEVCRELKASPTTRPTPLIFLTGRGVTRYTAWPPRQVL